MRWSAATLGIAWHACIGAMALVLSGCVHLPAGRDRSGVSQQLVERTGHALGPRTPCDQLIVPAGLDQGRKLSEDETVMLALWNNPAFLELLVDVQLTRADLIQAGLLPNPEAVYFFHVPDKPLKYLVDFPLERSGCVRVRLRIADHENARAVERLTQAALDLIRDTRQAYADLLLARTRLRISQEASQIRGDIAKLADTRQKAGDASVQEAATAKIDSLLAEQDETRIKFEAPLAEERFRNLLGFSGLPVPIVLEESKPEERPLPAVDELSTEALRSRPDLLAADQAIAAAAERLRFAKIGWVRFLGILDATSGRATGHEFGPAARLTLPIFNRNQGAIARAAGELEQLERRRLTLRNQIALEVRQAHIRYRQANAELTVLQTKIQPELDAALRRAERSYLNGAASLLIVFETRRQVIDTKNREAQLRADQRRAWADLERSVGRRLAPTPAVPGSTP